VELDEASEPLGARIRKGKLEKIPYLLVVGEDDVVARTVGVNERGASAPERGVPFEELFARLAAEATR